MDSLKEISWLVEKTGTNRLISARTPGWDFVPPYDFTAEFMGDFRCAPRERTNPLVDKNLQNPIWWARMNDLRTFLEENLDWVGKFEKVWELFGDKTVSVGSCTFGNRK